MILEKLDELEELIDVPNVGKYPDESIKAMQMINIIVQIRGMVSALGKSLPKYEDIITAFDVLHPIDINNSTLEQCFLQGIRQSAFLSGARWMRDQISSQVGKEATE